MSFHTSEPPQTTSAAQQRQNRPSPTSWTDEALDELIFQESDLTLPIPQMGTQSRPNSSPSPSDPPFPVVETLPPEFASFHTGSTGNDRLVLESNRLDFETVSKRPRSNPAPVEQKGRNGAKLAKSQPAPVFRQRSGRPCVPMSSSPAPAEAFGVSDLREDVSADISASRAQKPKRKGLGPYVQQVMNFNREQQRGTKAHSLERFWKPLIASYFSADANLHLSLRSDKNNKARTIRMPVEALPRIWRCKLECGMRSERMLLENACEFEMAGGMVVVDCPRTVILTRFAHSMVQTNGHLRVGFRKSGKIALWEFSAQIHEEMFSERILNASGIVTVPRPACSEYGVPEEVLRLMMIANDVNDIAGRIGTEIAKLAANRDRMQGIGKTERRNAAGAQKLRSNGNAFRALSSMLEGKQDEQAGTDAAASMCP